MGRDEAPQFQPDSLISWDFSDKDFPCVTVVCLEKEKDTPRVVARFLGDFHIKTGVVSLRQLLEYRDAADRAEKERNLDLERLKDFISHKPQDEKEADQ
jgi:hypothetical protein